MPVSTSGSWPVGPVADVTMSQPQKAGKPRGCPSAGSQRPLCSGLLSWTGPFFQAQPPTVFCGLLCWGSGNRSGGRPPSLRNGLFPSFVQEVFLCLWTQWAPQRPRPRGVRCCQDNHGQPALDDWECNAPGCFWGDLGQAGPAPCWSPPCPHKARPAGRGLPTLFRSAPLGRCCWCPPQGPSAPVPRFTHSSPQTAELSPGLSKLAWAPAWDN